MTAKRMLIVLVLCAVVFGGVFGMKEFGRRAMVDFLETMPLPTITISAATAQRMRWDDRLQGVGTLTAIQGTDVTVEEGGIVRSIHFRSGEAVEAGQLLLELDADNERAELARLQAEAELAALTLSRRERLFKLESISRAELDEAQSQEKVARAAVAAQKARLALKRVKAPFTGTIGIRRVSLGQYLAPGDAIAALEQLDPIEVDFSLPETEASRVAPGMPVELAVAAVGRDGLRGEVVALESRVDAQTRTVAVRARVDNRDGQLRPGHFARVQVLLPGQRDVLTVPRTAIQYSSYGDSVYVIRPAPPKEGDEAAAGNAADQSTDDDEPALQVERRFVRLGEARGDFIVVEEGLEPGDRVASAGLLKLRNGQPVVISEEGAPQPELSPQPPEG